MSAHGNLHYAVILQLFAPKETGPRVSMQMYFRESPVETSRKRL
jgi:hypothetical protein